MISRDLSLSHLQATATGSHLVFVMAACRASGGTTVLDLPGVVPAMEMLL
jgi:hypothetical protein